MSRRHHGQLRVSDGNDLRSRHLECAGMVGGRICRCAYEPTRFFKVVPFLFASGPGRALVVTAGTHSSTTSRRHLAVACIPHKTCLSSSVLFTTNERGGRRQPFISGRCLELFPQRQLFDEHKVRMTQNANIRVIFLFDKHHDCHIWLPRRKE